MFRDPVLIGRAQELDHLRQALASTLAGRGTLVGLVGDAGVGKTHLGTVLAREAEAAGCVVAWGRCRESDGAPAFWPWTQALATIDRAYSDAGVSAVLSRAHGTADLLASLATSRVTLFAQVGGALLDLARTRPLVVVLDDLHRADLPSLRLLAWLAHDAASAPLLVVATWRDGEVRRDPERESVLAEVARAGRILLVGGLGAVEVGNLLRTRLGDDLDPRLPQAVAELTGGNPFFVLEVASMLAGSSRRSVDDLARLPSSAGVRGMVRQRFDAMPAPTVETVQAAAVLGREFDVTVLAAMVGCGVEDAVARLAPAERLGLLHTDPAALRRYVFAHALVRDTIYDLLPATEIAPLHRRAAEAVVATAGASLDAVLTTVSHHHFEAARGGDARDAAAWSARAARQSLSRLAFEDAVVCFERALQALDCVADADPAERTDVTMGLAEALAGAGRHDRA
ncbi:AAA family ATPase, partial [Candidatus Binatia bacterium]|nr:AAA family ATPase [Candidatus Binatia bacterium]